MVDGKTLRLADEVRYIQRRAADHDGRIVTIGQLVLFSTDTGDAWLLDPSDQLAARLARDGDPEPIRIEENDTAFAIDWKGRYRIDGSAFVYIDRETGNLTTVHGYPTHKLRTLRTITESQSPVLRGVSTSPEIDSILNGTSAARLAATPAVESPANRRVQSLL